MITERRVGNAEILRRLIERARHEARLLDELDVELNLDWALQSLKEAGASTPTSDELSGGIGLRIAEERGL